MDTEPHQSSLWPSSHTHSSVSSKSFEIPGDVPLPADWEIAKTSSDKNVAGPQEGHVLSDECYSPHQSFSAAEYDKLSLRSSS
ncbi:hypothetical protein H8959_005118 [Pygathrix nigripes]